MTLSPRKVGAFVALVSLIVVTMAVATGTSATPRTRIVVLKDLVYAVPPEGPLTLDVYRPEEGWGHPSLLVIHGGSWKRGDKSDWQYAARDLARGGFAVFVVNYRLAPPGGDATYPTPVTDLHTAWAWMQQNAARYHGDAKNIAVVGSSAGGHLGLLLASEMSGERDGPKAVVGLSPPTDLARMGAEGPLRGAVQGHLGCRLQACPDRYTVASPVNRVGSGFPPTFLAYSSDELIPLSHGEELRDRLNETGVPNRFVVNEGSDHALRMAGAVIPKAMRFLRRHMAP
jgi:acetyl esterase/lipase